MNDRFGMLLRGSAAVCLLAGLFLPHTTGAAPDGGLQVKLSGKTLAGRTGNAFDVQALTPGESASVVLHVRAPVQVGGELWLRFLDVHDDDNGCTPAEAPVDRSCGLGGGELAQALTFAASSAVGVKWSGTVAEIERGADIGALPATAGRWIRMTATLPAAAGNEVQSDSLAFRLRVELHTTHGVAGVTVGPGRSSPKPGPLARTGVPTGLLVLGGVLLVTAGAMIARRSRPSTRPLRRTSVDPPSRHG